MVIVQGPAWRSQMHQFRSLCLRLDPHPCHHYFLMPHCNNKICIFESWKNTTHPPIIGAFGHSTDCIVKQPKTATIKIDLYSYFIQSCSVLPYEKPWAVMQKLPVQTIKYTRFRKFQVFLAFVSDGVCRRFNLYFSNFQKSW